MRHLSSHCLPALAVLLALACDVDASAPGGSECGDVLCSSSGKADEIDAELRLVLDEALQWQHRDATGDTEATHAVPGRVQLSFFGEPLPLADPGPLLPAADSFLQPAVLRLEMSTLRDPRTRRAYQFFALLQSSDGGEHYAIDTNCGGQATLIDTSEPDAVEQLNAAYDAGNQRGNPTSGVPADLGGFDFGFAAIRFERVADGSLRVQHIAAGLEAPDSENRWHRYSLVSTRRTGSTTSGNASDLEARFSRGGDALVVELDGLDGVAVDVIARTGSFERIEPTDLLHAAQQAIDRSFATNRTVGVFGSDGRFALADLARVPPGGGGPIDWKFSVGAHYAPTTRALPVGDGSLLFAVDYSLPEFETAFVDLRTETKTPIHLAGLN